MFGWTNRFQPQGDAPNNNYYVYVFERERDSKNKLPNVVMCTVEQHKGMIIIFI